MILEYENYEVDHTTDVDTGLKKMEYNSYDGLLLDIQMPKMTGFEWLKTLPKLPQIIVTSAHKEYALEGYELDVLDYLLKPFSLSRFLQAVNKVNPLKEEALTKSFLSGGEHGLFFLKGDKQHHQIYTGSILFVEALGNYTKVHLADDMIISHEKISKLEKVLPKAKFLRVHKSFLVSLDKIKSIQGNQIYLEGHKIPIGQTYRAGINHLLGGK